MLARAIYGGCAQGMSGDGFKSLFIYYYNMQKIRQNGQPEGNNADALKQRVAAMHKFYFKGITGFSGTQGIANASDFYRDAQSGFLAAGKDEKFWADEVHARFFRLKKIYSAIPFAELHGNADYYPLFAANNALKMAERKMNDALAETEPARIEVRNKELVNLFILFMDWGAVYKERINMLFKKIHELEGNRDFELELIDINGKSWGKKSRL